ncbi:3-dehydroquinate synthase [Metabacillus sp. RGM 3146]|uniref:3-dehydroquinate synthase n=1 Tax=Metabacillus sp. RGM 3146 TaxID=3401092 RepID=UPI003B9A6849
MKNIQVNAGSSSYPVLIGDGVFGKLQEVLEASGMSPSKLLIVTDENVNQFYGNQIESAAGKIAGWCKYVTKSGEAAKSFEVFYDIQTFALREGLDRKSVVLAFGGGVIGDLAGFFAATYMRGIPFVQIPTTLLAHDSAVGGKTGINHPEGKNMIGAFYQPLAVIYDTAFLRTLPLDELRSGLAEVIKHAFIKDKDMYEMLHSKVRDIQFLSQNLLVELISMGISIKASIVSEDEREQGVRSYLNFGHTLGHALEKLLGYGRISHGDAVAAGMIFALWLSEKTNHADLKLQENVSWFKELGFPVSLPDDISSEKFISAMEKDKKAESGVIYMILLKEFGRAEKHAFSRQQLLELLNEWRAEVHR